MPSWKGSRACLRWTPSPACPLCSPSLKPQGQWSPGGERSVGWGPGPGAQGPGVQARGPGGSERKSGSGSNSTDSWGGGGAGGGGRAGNTSTRVAQGSSGAKLSRKETHISHVSLAGPTAGAVRRQLRAAPTLEPRSLKMISTSKIFPNCCRDRDKEGVGQTGKCGLRPLARPPAPLLRRSSLCSALGSQTGKGALGPLPPLAMERLGLGHLERAMVGIGCPRHHQEGPWCGVGVGTALPASPGGPCLPSASGSFSCQDTNSSCQLRMGMGTSPVSPPHPART